MFVDPFLRRPEAFRIAATISSGTTKDGWKTLRWYSHAPSAAQSFVKHTLMPPLKSA